MKEIELVRKMLDLKTQLWDLMSEFAVLIEEDRDDFESWIDEAVASGMDGLTDDGVIERLIKKIKGEDDESD